MREESLFFFFFFFVSSLFFFLSFSFLFRARGLLSRMSSGVAIPDRTAEILRYLNACVCVRARERTRDVPF